MFSEEVVGRWWQSRAIPRGQLVLATRLGLGRVREGVSMVKFAQDCARASLRRLKTSYVDLLILEWSESFLPMNELMAVFDALVRGGFARYIGVANFPVWRVAEAIGRAPLGNHSRMEALQSDYSLMTRARFEPEAMALCREQRLGFLARAPLAGGFLVRGKKLGDRFNVHATTGLSSVSATRTATQHWLPLVTSLRATKHRPRKSLFRGCCTMRRSRLLSLACIRSRS